MDSFDLTQTPSRIQPDFAFIALLLGVGVGLFILARFILRHAQSGVSDFEDRVRNIGRFMSPFSMIWLGFTCLLSAVDVGHAYITRRDVRQGRYMILEGCLDRFHAGLADPGKGRGGDETWTLKGHDFAYGTNEFRFAYHKVEPEGGLVHADSWIEVSFVPNELWGDNDIIRLAVKPHACPPARDGG